MMNLPSSITVCEVGLRDGLPHLGNFLSVEFDLCVIVASGCPICRIAYVYTCWHWLFAGVAIA